MEKGDQVEFLDETTLQPGGHALYQSGNKFYLGVFDDRDGTILSIKDVREFSTLAEAQAALARVRGEVH